MRFSLIFHCHCVTVWICLNIQNWHQPNFEHEPLRNKWNNPSKTIPWTKELDSPLMLGFYLRLPFKQYVHVAVAQQSLQNGWLSVGRKKYPQWLGFWYILSTCKVEFYRFPTWWISRKNITNWFRPALSNSFGKLSHPWCCRKGILRPKSRKPLDETGVWKWGMPTETTTPLKKNMLFD